MASAQDKALATLCLERSLLDEEGVERARAAHARANRGGAAPPLGQLLVDGGFLESKVAADLLRELVLSTFHCPKCGRTWTYEDLSALQRYRCDACSERLERKRPRGTSGVLAPNPFANNARPDATEAMSRRPTRGVQMSGASQLASPPAVPRLEASSPDPPARAAPSPGTKTLGPYELVKELGRGAMGVVYLAKRPGLERLFALKVMLGSKLADQEAIDRFRREAALASRLQDPAIISVHDVGQAGEYYYYAMDYCPGRTLQALITEDGKKEPNEAARLVAQLAHGAQAAHANGIVHRDLKPANVILDAKTGQPRITDFGLARDGASVLAGMTRTGDVLGTPYYMAPEQFRGERDVDARVDVYALGVILYELVAGRKPFIAETAALVASHVLTEDPPPLRDFVPDVPPPLAAIAAKALARDKNDRYRNAGALAKDLERFLAGEPVLARPETFLEGVLRKARKRLTPQLVGGTVLVLAIGSTLGFYALSSKKQIEEEKRTVATAEEQNELKAFRADVANLNETAKRALPIEDLLREREKLAQKAASSAPLVAEQGIPELDLAWATILERRARSSEAGEIASRHEKHPALGPVAKRLHAQSLLARGKTKEGLDLLQELEASPDAGTAAYARLARAASDPKRALALALERKLAECSDGATLVLLARVLAEDGVGEGKEPDKNKEARAALDRALGLALDDARAHLVRATFSRPRLGSALARRRPRFDREPEPDPTREDDLAAFAKLAGPEADRDADYLRERALGDLAAKRYAEAVGHLDAALAARQGDLEVDLARAWYVDETGFQCRSRAIKKDEARLHATAASLELPDLRELVAIVTSQSRARLESIAARAVEPARQDLGRALLASARLEPTDSVRELFQAAKSAGPTCPVVATETARFLLSRGDHKASLDEIARARGLAGADASLLDRLELETRERQARRSETARVLERIGEKNTESAIGLSAAFDLARRAGTPTKEEAARLVHEADASAPRDAAAHRILAWALLRHSMAQDADASLTDSVEDAAWGPLQLEGLLDVESYAAIVFAREVRFLHESIQEMRAGRPDEQPRRGDFRRLERMQRRFLDNLQAHKELNGLWSCARSYTELADLNLLVRRDFAIAYEQVLGGDGSVESAFGAAIEREPDSPLGEECFGYFCLTALDQPKKAGSHWKKARATDPEWKLPAYMLGPVRELNPDLASRYGDAGK